MKTNRLHYNNDDEEGVGGSKYPPHTSVDIEDKLVKYRNALLYAYDANWSSHYTVKAAKLEAIEYEEDAEILTKGDCVYCDNSTHYVCNGCIQRIAGERGSERKIRSVLFICAKCQAEHLLNFAFEASQSTLDVVMSERTR